MSGRRRVVNLEFHSTPFECEGASAQDLPRSIDGILGILSPDAETNHDCLVIVELGMTGMQIRSGVQMEQLHFVFPLAACLTCHSAARRLRSASSAAFFSAFTFA